MGLRLAVGSLPLDGSFNREVVRLLLLGDRRFEWGAVAHSISRLEERALVDAKWILMALERSLRH